MISIGMILSIGTTVLAEESEVVNSTDHELEVQIVEEIEEKVPQEINADELVKANDFPLNVSDIALVSGLESGIQLTETDNVLNPASMARSASGVIQSWTGAIANEGEFAYYITTLAPKQILSATLVCPQNPDLNYDLLLYEIDANGYLGNMLNGSITETYMNTYPNGVTKTMDESLAYINNTAETKNYAVIVLATTGGSASDTFKLTLSIDVESSYDALEYNNSPYDAYELPELTVNGQNVPQLSLHMSNDQDWFLLRNSSSEISLASITTEVKGYQIEVYTVDGNKMKLAKKSNGLYKIQPGVNYIKVFADETEFISSEYLLSISGLSNSPSNVQVHLNGDEGPNQYPPYPQGKYFRFKDKFCPEVHVFSEHGFPVPGYSVELFWESGGWSEQTGNKFRHITSVTGNNGIAVLTLGKGQPSPNDLPISLGLCTYMQNGPITFRDYYDVDAAVISAYGQILFQDGLYHLMRSDYISS